MKILFPIEFLLSKVFSFSYKLTGHYGYALILMSVCITIITTPIYLLADYWKNQEKKIQDLMKDDIDCIKNHYSKQKQFYLIRTIKALALSDGLFFSINLLPIIMTLLNVISSIVYSRSFRLKDNTQAFVLAAVFLLFLYDRPSALLIYWSFNNFFSLVKNLIIEFSKKNKEKFCFVNFGQELKKNRNILLYIFCTLLLLVFSFTLTYKHKLIKYCFLKSYINFLNNSTT